jgi:hypothetical protein
LYRARQGGGEREKAHARGRRRLCRKYNEYKNEEQWWRSTGGIDPAHRRVIFASSLGTVFEWYDFYLYGSLVAIITKKFFSGMNDTTGFLFALLAFAAGFFVRPFGALVFGRLGDLVGPQVHVPHHHRHHGRLDRTGRLPARV